MKFTEQYKEHIDGILHGFDRIVIRGHLRCFVYPKSIYYYLGEQGILMKDYRNHVQQQTAVLKQHLEQLAQQNGVKIQYVNNYRVSKESIALAALEQHSTQKDLISILSTPEVAYSYTVRKNRETGLLEMRSEARRCLHYYLYFVDQEFGWMHIRIQSWFPFRIQVYINGREYLKGQLSQQGIAFKSYKNSVCWVADLDKAQQLSDKLVQKKWDRFLNVLARRVNPWYDQIKSIMGSAYEWFTYQAEYACDVLFKERSVLEQFYPTWVQYSTLFRGGEDIYTFFGRQLTATAKKEVQGSCRKFTQGFRVKHTLNANSIKMYDKSNVLRVETTINNSRAFKIYKSVIRDGHQTKAWVPMGKHVSNLYRYAQVAQSANVKYLDSLCIPDQPSGLNKEVERISEKTTTVSKTGANRNFSAFNLLSKDTSLILEAINDARFCIQSFTNQQLRELLLDKGFFDVDLSDPGAVKRLSGKVTRLIAKLRAHKLVVKISNSFKYRVSKRGMKIIYKILNFKTLQLNAA